MAQQRQIQQNDRFDKDLRSVCRKHHDLEDNVKGALTTIATSETPPGDKIPGIGGQPAYKLRIKCGNKGKRGGARLIYYCAEALVVPLFIYVKNEIEDIPRKEIADALVAAGLVAPKS
jgi:hypothetical protein